MSFKFSAQNHSGDPSPLQSIVTGDGYEMATVSESFSGDNEWSIVRERTSLIFHLGGYIDAIESEFDGRGSKLDPPMPGEMWLVPEGVRYSSRVRGMSANYIEFTYDQASFGQNKRLKPVAGTFDHKLFKIAHQIFCVNDSGNDVSSLHRYELLSDMIGRINKVFVSSPEPRTKRKIEFDIKQRTDVITFILDNLDEQITLEKLCGLVGEIPHRFLWAFRNAFNSTPAQYILDQRLRLARRLLTTTRMDITSIALETGFSNHSHLSTAFIKRNGVSPSHFRKLS